ncbi:hypothetical protein K402DRAFT_150873 [Aulographum hederae CBS 113979]|uniref:Uncharacterized protein n=1 Tax=Aulographum hederae CBS 113979 TaxID=1176131 RepID=A0A6G1GTK4_9PEZI|nr:hypothetical protein K402DRAFT_150873 [Aulographum hederae CBS 113979]
MITRSSFKIWLRAHELFVKVRLPHHSVDPSSYAVEYTIPQKDDPNADFHAANLQSAAVYSHLATLLSWPCHVNSSAVLVFHRPLGLSIRPRNASGSRYLGLSAASVPSSSIFSLPVCSSSTPDLCRCLSLPSLQAVCRAGCCVFALRRGRLRGGMLGLRGAGKGVSMIVFGQGVFRGWRIAGGLEGKDGGAFARTDGGKGVE